MFCDAHTVCGVLRAWVYPGHVGAEMKDVGTHHNVDLRFSMGWMWGVQIKLG